MKKLLSAVLVLVIGLLFALTPNGAGQSGSLRALAAPDSTHPSDGRVELETTAYVVGVVASRFGHDLEALTVQLLSPQGDVVGSTRTGADGEFRLVMDGSAARLRVLDQVGRLLALDNENDARVAVFGRGRRERVLWLANQRSQELPRVRKPAVVQATASITGVVTAADSGLPLVGVSVYMWTYDFGYAASTTTDGQGNYDFSELPAGDYRVQFPQPSGYPMYAPEWYSDQSDATTSTLVHVSAGQTAGGINAALKLGGTITGRATAADTGFPLGGVYIRAYDGAGSRISQVRTDASGYYTTTALRTGTYRMYFRRDDYSEPSMEYLKEYYNHQQSLAAATSINVTAPQVTAGINMTLSHGGQISGTVTSAQTGLPVDGYSLTLIDCYGFFSGAGTDSSGGYLSLGLPSGNYRIQAADGSVTYNNRPDLADADPIHVIAPHLQSNINLALPAEGMITGTVTLNDAPPPLYTVQINAYNSQTGNYSSQGSVDASGVYSIANLPTGSYDIEFSTPNDGYVTQRVTVHVATPTVVANVNVNLLPGGRIAGTVTSATDGSPLDGINVTAYDAFGMGRGVQTASDGSYQTVPLAPGTYRLKFNPGRYSALNTAIHAYQYYSNTLTLASALAVVVTDSVTTTGIDVALASGGFISGTYTWPQGSVPGLSAFYTPNIYVYNSDGKIVGYGSDTGLGYPYGYRTTGLPTGSYKVVIDPGSMYRQCAGPLAQEFYNFKFDYNTADAVSVSAPNTTNGINLMLNVIWRVLLPALRR